MLINFSNNSDDCIVTFISTTKFTTTANFRFEKVLVFSSLIKLDQPSLVFPFSKINYGQLLK